MAINLSPEDIQTVLDRGVAARELMAAPCFLSTIDDLSTFHLAALVAAEPGKTGQEARDHHHLIHYALREIVSDIRQRIDAADDLEARLANRDPFDEDDE